MNLDLKNITLVVVDCVDVQRALRAINRCTRVCSFASVKLLTSLPSQSPHRVQIDQISSIEDYSKFIMKELYKYVDTDFVLIAQHDGFIWMPHMWSEEFLKYDYIGAPWPKELLKPGIPPTYDVGNGGFSLRSKRLQTFLALDEHIKMHPAEDVAICQFNREYLEDNNFTFAPASLARKFSWECLPCAPAFGIHGRLSLRGDT